MFTEGRVRADGNVDRSRVALRAESVPGSSPSSLRTAMQSPGEVRLWPSEARLR